MKKVFFISELVVIVFILLSGCIEADKFSTSESDSSVDRSSSNNLVDKDSYTSENINHGNIADMLIGSWFETRVFENDKCIQIKPPGSVMIFRYDGAGTFYMLQEYLTPEYKDNPPDLSWYCHWELINSETINWNGNTFYIDEISEDTLVLSFYVDNDHMKTEYVRYTDDFVPPCYEKEQGFGALEESLAGSWVDETMDGGEGLSEYDCVYTFYLDGYCDYTFYDKDFDYNGSIYLFGFDHHEYWHIEDGKRLIFWNEYDENIKEWYIVEITDETLIVKYPDTDYTLEFKRIGRYK